MKVFLGSDHGGLELKRQVAEFLKEKVEVADLGDFAADPADDYPLFAAKVAEEVSLNPGSSRGILFCRGGAGVDITANKFKGVRSVLGISPEQVRAARNDDDVNVLSIASDYTDAEKAREMARVFLETPFEGAERQKRRLQEIADIENSS